MTVRDPKTCAHAACPETRRARIQQLNDAFRRTGRGGTILFTSGVQGLGVEGLALVLAAVREFDAFSRDNDPYGEHDFGAFRAAGQRLFWKIDCYDCERRNGSPDPADPAVTVRVLTIMLASEY